MPDGFGRGSREKTGRENKSRTAGQSEWGIDPIERLVAQEICYETVVYSTFTMEGGFVLRIRVPLQYAFLLARAAHDSHTPADRLRNPIGGLGER